MSLFKRKPPPIDPRDIGWVPLTIHCPWCTERFREDSALRIHKHVMHGVRGRITPKRLWSDG